MSLKKIILLFFTYIIVIVYSLEFLSIIFLKKNVNLNEISIDQIRNQKIKSIENFDNRKNSVAYNEEKLINNQLSPSFKFSTESLFLSDVDGKIKKFIDDTISSNQKIPFRGPINKISLGSNEAGKREIIINDKYGFKNKNEIYSKNIDIMILGDSFTEGVPFNNSEDIAGKIMTKSNYNVGNFGVNGTGPFIGLAITKEYASKFQPKNVFYLFYEGNDLRDMMFEEKTFLKRYLEENFTQNLFKSNKEKIKFLNDYENVFYEILPLKIEEEKKRKNNIVLKEMSVNEKIKDFLELNTLKELLLVSSVFYKKKHKVDYKYFDQIIFEMNAEIKTWNGNFYFIYLPSWTRYNNKYSVANHFQKSKIKKIVESKGVIFIDIDEYFKTKEVNNINIFNLGVYGHYTKKGYELIADKIVNVVSNSH